MGLTLLEAAEKYAAAVQLFEAVWKVLHQAEQSLSEARSVVNVSREGLEAAAQILREAAVSHVVREPR